MFKHILFARTSFRWIKSISLILVIVILSMLSTGMVLAESATGSAGCIGC